MAGLVRTRLLRAAAGLAWLAVAVASAPALFGLYTSLAGQSVFLNAPEDR